LIFISDIPHLKTYKQKVLLPKDEKYPSINSVVFIINNNIQSSIGLLNHQFIKNNNMYHFYFMDHVYNGKLFNRTFRVLYRNERNDIYNNIEKEVRFIQTVLDLHSVNKKNIYVDLIKHNSLFFQLSKKVNFTIRIKNYIDYLDKLINDSHFNQYKYKTICIDINSWVSDLKTQIKGKLNFDNPIFIIYYCMYKYLEKFKELGDINIIFYTNDSVLRLNPSLCDKSSYSLFKKEIIKASPKSLLDMSEDNIEKVLKRKDVADKIIGYLNDQHRFVGDDKTEEDENFETSIEDKVDEIIDANKLDNNSNDEMYSEVSKVIINDDEIIKKIHMMNQENKVGRSTASIKRDEELRKRQKEIIKDKIGIDNIYETNKEQLDIPKFDVTDKVNTTNKNVTTIRYPQFEKAYNEVLHEKDLLNNIKFLNEKSIPVYIRGIERVDSSDELNLKETYTFDLEDENRVRHKLKFDIPKFIDDKFLYLGGNKKIIMKQLFMKPVVKTGPDEVQICTNYNKMFIRRYGNKISSKIEKMRKLLYEQKEGKGIKVKYGNNLSINNKYDTTIEYDELSKSFTYIRIGKTEFYFNQDDATNIVKDKKIKLNQNEFLLGLIENGKNPIPITIDKNTQKIGTSFDIVDYILSMLTQGLVQDFDDTKSGKKFVYTRAYIMERHVPVVLLISFLEGLSTVIKKANIKHYFSDKRPKDITHNEGIIQFSDGYLIYEKYPFENSLLMNAFADIPTKTFEYGEFDSKDVYLSLFDTLYGNRIIGNAFLNSYEFLIDPITREVLEDLNYPTDYVSLVLYANSLLATNSYIKENNMNLYRIRSNELVNALLYKEVANAYIKYRTTSLNNNPVKISVPQDVIIKKILVAQTVEDYSTLNPITEVEKSRMISPKGHSGMNLDEAYTQDKRAYDKTMLGIIAMSTSPDSSCGVTRQLTLEPNIKNPRGYIDINDDRLEILKDANLFSPAELLSPLGNTRDELAIVPLCRNI